MRRKLLPARYLGLVAGPLVAAPLLAAGVLAGPGPAAAPAPACQSWAGAQPPSPGTRASSLAAVAVLSGCNAWAAGFQQDTSSPRQTLIEHWNGSSWTPVPTPDPGSGDNFLTSIRASSPASIWAVGGFVDDTGIVQPLVLHYDGSAWTRQNTPVLAGSQLNGVRAVAANNVWAVGYAENQDATLILHWDGTAWSQVPSPSPGGGNILNSIAAHSASDAWAVGVTSSSPFGARGRPAPGGRATATADPQALILHWNGTSWQRVPSPSPGAVDLLTSVGASSATSAWAVGLTQASITSAPQTFTLRWNGSAWKQVASPDPGGPGRSDQLFGVVVNSASSAWAVGSSAGSKVIILRWNGSAWAAVPSPNPGSLSNELLGVAAQSASNIWGVGDFGAGPPSPDQAFAIHCC
jgi:hypothetical protein